MSLLVLGMMLPCTASASKELDLSPHYVRQRYGQKEGLLGGGINAMAQTPDGCLWIATDQMLLRFDGRVIHPVSIDPKLGSTSHIVSLTVDLQGTLWIRRDGEPVLLYQGGTFRVPSWPGGYTVRIGALASATDAGVVFWNLDQGLIQAVGDQYRRSGAPTTAVIFSIAQTSDRRVWLGTSTSGLRDTNDQNPLPVGMNLPSQRVNCLLAAKANRLWIGTDHGLALWTGTTLARGMVPSPLREAQILSLAEDSHANVWVGTTRGLFRYNAGKATSMDQGNATANHAITALFTDRDGNVWAGDSGGIEKFQVSPILRLPNTPVSYDAEFGAIAVDDTGRIWMAPRSGGLYWFSGGHLRRFVDADLGSEVIYSICTVGSRDIWLGRQLGGITHIHLTNGTATARTYTRRDGLLRDNIFAVHADRDGSLWTGSLTGGASHLIHGRFVNYTTTDGLASNAVSAVAQTPDGTQWFATSAGLSSLSTSGWHTYTTADGLPSSDITSLYLDSEGTLWVGSTHGLSYFNSGTLHTAAPDVLQQPVLGMTEDRSGFLWIDTAGRLLRADRRTLLGGHLRTGDLIEFGPAAGLPEAVSMRRGSAIVRDGQGRILIALKKGLVLIAPELVGSNTSAPLVHLDNALVDGSATDYLGGLHVPSGSHRISIEYTGVSLAESEQTRYKYRLDGFDRDWSQEVETRQATYTNLAPATYRFRVIADSHGGRWNGPELILPITVEPAFWQTWSFRGFLALSIALLGFVFYHLRIRNITQRIQIGYDQRLIERTRIAQALHDTLLQGFASAALRLHTAARHIPADAPSRLMIDGVQQQIDRVLDEGRNAVFGLRTMNSHEMRLEQAVAKMLDEMSPEDASHCHVRVDGTSRPLNDTIFDDVCRIIQEAISNASRHAAANQIRIAIAYGTHNLYVEVTDDGCGIHPHCLKSGKPGHWGLAGIRERAAQIGARLALESKPGIGTRLVLDTPARVAFPSPPSGNFWQTLLRS